jgi:hypothetical protein
VISVCVQPGPTLISAPVQSPLPKAASSPFFAISTTYSEPSGPKITSTMLVNPLQWTTGVPPSAGTR